MRDTDVTHIHTRACTPCPPHMHACAHTHTRTHTQLFANTRGCCQGLSRVASPAGTETLLSQGSTRRADLQAPRSGLGDPLSPPGLWAQRCVGVDGTALGGHVCGRPFRGHQKWVHVTAP